MELEKVRCTYRTLLQEENEKYLDATEKLTALKIQLIGLEAGAYGNDKNDVVLTGGSEELSAKKAQVKKDLEAAEARVEQIKENISWLEKRVTSCDEEENKILWKIRDIGGKTERVGIPVEPEPANADEENFGILSLLSLAGCSLM